MCGIAGYIQRAPICPPVMDAMLARLAHRGPDAAGTWQHVTEGNPWHIVLGHRRLSIIDIEGSPQPMGNENGSVQITFNGEIYNFAQLRADAQRNGHIFQSRGDTEAVLHHLEEHGTFGLEHLNGMFALGLWDSTHRTLLLARDRAGIKPLYWARLPDGGIAFASELLALATHPGISLETCPKALAEFLFRDYVLPPHTMLRGVSKLLPGQWLRWEANNQSITTGTFWQPPAVDPTAKADEHELADLLNRAVESQLVADVPIGVFLSGGIDSSLVAAMAQRTVQTPLHTFSMGFDDPSFDESASAKRVARHIGSRHFHRTVTDYEMLSTIGTALSSLDEPIGDHSIVPTYLVSQMAAEHVKVVLGGDGGDELFGGYPTYLAHRAASLYAAMPLVARRHLIEPVIRALPAAERYQSLGWKLKRFALRWDDSPLKRHQRWMSATDLPQLDNLLGDGARPELLDPVLDGGLDAILRFDFQTYLPGSVLTKVDRASMIHGLEVRPPFLDNDVINYAFRLPSLYKLRGRTTKWILKQAALPYLPAGIIHRKKQGFSVPLARWLRGPLRDRAEASVNNAPPQIDRDVARQMLSAHTSGREDHSKTLWSLLVLDSWHSRLRTCKPINSLT